MAADGDTQALPQVAAAEIAAAHPAAPTADRPAAAPRPIAAPKPAVRPSATPAARAPAAAALPRTRFVVGMSRKSEFQVFSLANPNRVVVELPDVDIQLPDQRAGGATGLVKSFRGGLAAPGKTRIVIDVTEPVVVETAKVEKAGDGQHRLALEIVPLAASLKAGARKGLKVQPAGLGASGLQQPPLPKPAISPRLRAAKAFKPVIVIDPGHGGMDSGAVKYGTVEKNVVLAFSHTLRERLEKTGRYRVLMTRDKDIFIELDERLAYAERNSANLFIAIHADYASSRARGASIFTLRDRVAKDLQRSAKDRSAEKVLSASELKTVRRSSGENSTVTNILADLAERDVERTRERTDVFARAIVDNMSESTTMRNEPEQQAAFRVLKTAQFPSVLIELAYVTNQQDAQNLKSDEWREKVSDSISSAVDNYFSNQVALMPM
ncbi:MAG: N-acetylmuramoyl-L-alanine amidase [Hyphomicrobium sp.]